jgi:hypothetical protein
MHSSLWGVVPILDPTFAEEIEHQTQPLRISHPPATTPKADSWLHKPEAATTSLAIDVPPEPESALSAEAAQRRLPLSEHAVRLGVGTQCRSRNEATSQFPFGGGGASGWPGPGSNRQTVTIGILSWTV